MKNSPFLVAPISATEEKTNSSYPFLVATAMDSSCR